MDGPGVETYANHKNSTSSEPNSSAHGPALDAALPQRPTAQDIAMRRALVFIGIAAASAGLAYWIVRASLKTPPPADPTTERIQQLIEEANRLLKALDEKKPD